MACAKIAHEIHRRTNENQTPDTDAYNNNEKFRSFKSSANIHKKEVGPYCGFGY